VASAYTQTSAAWQGGMHLLVGWPVTFFDVAGGWGLIAFFLMLLGSYRLLVRPATRRWGPELWGWAVSYSAYLVLTTTLYSATFRFLMLAFPFSLLLVDVILSMGSRVIRMCLTSLTVCGGLALQCFWIANFLVVTHPAQPTFFFP
jgi:hypothetical protein